MSVTFSTFLSEKLRDEGEVRSVSQKYARSGENVGELWAMFHTTLSLFFCDTHSIRWILDPNQKHPRLYYKLQRNDWCCFCNNFIPFFLVFQNMENQIYRFSYDCCIGIMARKFECLYPQKSVVHKVKVWLIDIQILSKWYRFRGSHLDTYVTLQLCYINIDFISSEFCLFSSFKCLGQWSVLLFTSLALLYFKWLCLKHHS